MMEKIEGCRSKEDFLKKLRSVKAIGEMIWVVLAGDALITVCRVLTKILPDGVLSEGFMIAFDEFIVFQMLVELALIFALFIISRIRAEIEIEIIEMLFKVDTQRKMDNFVRS